MDVSMMERVVTQGRDSVLLRFGLGKHYLDNDDPARAVEHLRRCTELDPFHTAGWKLLGKALLVRDERSAAQQAWEAGISAARHNGHIQAEKEMSVFLRRLTRAS
ncbi:hypothetical protein IAE35_01150 [Pseudomonas sp. S75]|uniref:tetratricopeptide repeat protein n=1 Tax=unclassified Pseudomonas TaxID=196821 RepID=UPI0019081DCE|nr:MULTISPECIES: hypothetical protein [unclassified Pseudomonas]MBJ9974140.1 hypothetical protein [Pseudomonas sp. S30]MBK0151930.1 hypothetical protein [Pseudomonas sp. S75]